MNFRNDAPTGDVVSSKTAVFICLGVGVLFFVLNDLLRLINGGGIFSAVSAIRAAHARALSIDVDGASLRTPFVLLCALLTTTICMILRLRLAKNWTQPVFILCIIGGGFLVDAVYGPKMIETYLARSGYYRCVAHDHAVGAGKGRVWLDNYVLSNSECLAHKS